MAKHRDRCLSREMGDKLGKWAAKQRDRCLSREMGG
jgi:hypothetical protein